MLQGDQWEDSCSIIHIQQWQETLRRCECSPKHDFQPGDEERRYVLRGLQTFRKGEQCNEHNRHLCRWQFWSLRRPQEYEGRRLSWFMVETDEYEGRTVAYSSLVNLRFWECEMLDLTPHRCPVWYWEPRASECVLQTRINPDNSPSALWSLAPPMQGRSGT